MPLLPAPAKPRTVARGDLVTRTGVQSAGDPFEFVMASDDVDRMGDVIEIPGIDLAAFKSNPIALWGHDSASPIGTWESVRKVGGQLVGKLKLAAEGTSPLIDRLRKLIEQRILRAVSVGFRALDFVELDKKSFGLRYTKTELLECSLVAVPANAAALRLKGIAPDPVDTQIFRDLPRTPAPPDPSRGLRGRAEPTREPAMAPPPQRNKTMTTISEKIIALQARSVQIDDAINAIVRAAQDDGNRDYTDDEQTQIASLGDEKETVTRQIESNVAIERSLAVRAAYASNPPATVPATVRNEKPGALVVKMMASYALAHQTHKSLEHAADALYRDDERVKPALDWLQRSAVDIATTQRPGWAQELVTEGVGAFLADILFLSVYKALSAMGTTLQFGNHGTIVVPRRAAKGGLAGAFVGETGVIPVKQDALTSSLFERYKLAVISTFSKELENLSSPAIEQLIRDSISSDTSDLIDQKLLSALTQRPQVRPAGLLAGVTGIPSSGNTLANVNTDIKALFGALLQRQRVAVIMHPDRTLGLSLMTTATGDYVFKTDVEGGKFFGTTLIVSENVPKTTVIAVNAPDFATGNGTPAFDLSDSATLTMANSNNTAPTQAVKADGTLDVPEEVGVGLGISVVGGGQGTGTTGYEAVSMFQTWSTALRMVLPISWGMLRTGSVAALTAVNW